MILGWGARAAGVAYVALALIFVLAGCGFRGDIPVTAAVNGSGRVRVEVSAGGVSIFRDRVQLPWTKTFTVGANVVLTAEGSGDRDVTCLLLLRDKTQRLSVGAGECRTRIEVSGS
jgi:hypothetical protein